MKIYYAAPLFTEASQDYNAKVVGLIREKFGDKVNIYVPQENEAINDKSGYADSLMIIKGDNSHLLSSDLVIAHIDGQEIDAGVASEIGIAWHSKTPILGLYTDVRQSGLFHNDKKIQALDLIAENQFDYKNLYTTGLIKDNGKIVSNKEDLLNELGNELEIFKTKYFVKLEDKEKVYMDKNIIFMYLSELDGNIMVDECNFQVDSFDIYYTNCTVREILKDI